MRYQNRAEKENEFQELSGEENKEREKEKEELQIQFLSSFVKQNVLLNHSCSFVVVFIL